MSSGAERRSPQPADELPSGGRTVAGIVLAGGRSTRMGTSKAALEWHGSTLLRRVVGIVGRAVDGPVVVARAAAQPLTSLPGAIGVVDDAREGRGPLQGLAAGLAALDGRAERAYVSSIDVPLLHPAFVARVVESLDEEADVAIPRVDGVRQPLAACYRVELLGLVQELIAAGETRPAVLLERCRVHWLEREELLADAALAVADPGLASLRNLNQRSDFLEARALPAPEIRVDLRDRPGRDRAVRAATLAGAASSVSLVLDEHTAVALNGERVSPDPELPLVAGDRVEFTATDLSTPGRAVPAAASGELHDRDHRADQHAEDDRDLHDEPEAR
jgi:molybdopterin-guanine dinucleotide biosynthesis protein A